MKKTNDSDGSSFRELRAELDKVLHSLQREDIDVDEALDLYARGQVLVRELEKYLSRAENSVKKIKTAFEA